MKAIVSVIGKDKKGIIAKVSTLLFEMEINIEDISQTVMQEYFTMIMLVDLSASGLKFSDVSEKLKAAGDNIGVEIRVQTQDIFDAMHKI